MPTRNPASPTADTPPVGPPDTWARAAAETCNCFAIRKAARQVTSLYDECLAPAGITVGQYGILGRLERLGPLTINELASALGTDRTTMSRTLKPLERDGLVTVAANPDDRRRRAFSVTADGRVRLKTANRGWRDAQARIDAIFGAERASELRIMLAALAACDLTEAQTGAGKGLAHAG